MPLKTLKRNFCPTLKAVKISYAIAFLIITALGAFLIYFDLAGNNAYDLVAKTSEFSLSVAELESVYQRADITARELIVSGKSEGELKPAREAVFVKLDDLKKNLYAENQKRILEDLRKALEEKFVTYDEMIAAGISANNPNNLPQDLRARSVEKAKSVSEIFITLKLEEARGITDRAKDAEKHRRRFRISVLSIFLLLYAIWLVSYLLTVQAITAKTQAAEFLRQKYEKEKAENANFVGEKLYSDVLDFLEEKGVLPKN